MKAVKSDTNMLFNPLSLLIPRTKRHSFLFTRVWVTHLRILPSALIKAGSQAASQEVTATHRLHHFWYRWHAARSSRSRSAALLIHFLLILIPDCIECLEAVFPLTFLVLGDVRTLDERYLLTNNCDRPVFRPTKGVFNLYQITITCSIYDRPVFRPTKRVLSLLKNF